MKRLVYVIMAIFIVLWLWSGWGRFAVGFAQYAITHETNANLTKAAEWGESFGAFNALVSAGGFIAIIYTLLLQIKSARTQANDIHRQRFEQTFFKLLNLMRQLRQELSYSYSEEYIRGRSVGISGSPFRVRVDLKKSRKDFRAVTAALTEISYWVRKDDVSKVTESQLSDIYIRRIHNRNETRLAPYFRLIYTILHNIKTDSVLSEPEKIRYANLLRGMMTSQEIYLVAINALSPVSGTLRSLLCHFHMLKYLPNKRMRAVLSDIYDPVAFSPRD